jgi:hypothetical protein
MRIYTFDTTLRDGTQGEGISLSVDDKLTIARKLDDRSGGGRRDDRSRLLRQLR